MHPSIRILCSHHALDDAIEGMLIKRDALRRTQRCDDIRNDARRYARDTVAAAQREAEAIRRYAAARGYRDGLREAWRSIAPWLETFDQHCAAALDTLRRELSRALEASFEHAHIVEFVVDRVVADLSASTARHIRIGIPASLKGLISDLKTWAARAPGARVDVAIHDGDRLTIECGEAVYVFDMRSLTIELTEACRSLARSRESSARAGIDSTVRDTLASGRAALASIDTGVVMRQEVNAAAADVRP